MLRDESDCPAAAADGAAAGAADGAAAGAADGAAAGGVCADTHLVGAHSSTQSIAQRTSVFPSAAAHPKEVSIIARENT
ncbi:MAG: hypothetical protein EBR10_05215 [Planctomycetes bacterium]|nr:hypothetical protein [Planctomycetota bacterium]